MSNLRFSGFRQINTTLTADTFEPVVDASQLNDLSYWLIIVWEANSWYLKVLLYELEFFEGHSGEEWTSSDSLSLFLINEADVSSSGCRTVFLFFFLVYRLWKHTEAAVALSQLQFWRDARAATRHQRVESSFGFFAGWVLRQEANL